VYKCLYCILEHIPFNICPATLFRLSLKKKKKDKRIKQVFKGGHKERVNENEYGWMYFLFICENRFHIVEIVVRRGGGRMMKG
jgi:hypothetical protein